MKWEIRMQRARQSMTFGTRMQRTFTQGWRLHSSLEEPEAYKATVINLPLSATMHPGQPNSTAQYAVDSLEALACL